MVPREHLYLSGWKKENKKISQERAGEKKHLDNVQLTLLQHGFELHESTYTQIFFSRTYSTV